MKYPELEGLCKDCLYKCQKCEDINFRGVYKCEYYIKERRRQNVKNKR